VSKRPTPRGPAQRPTEKRPASFRLPPELLDRVRKAADKRGSTVTAVVEWCLEESLAQLER
jgi:predicted DNA-binding protein